MECNSNMCNLGMNLSYSESITQLCMFIWPHISGWYLLIITTSCCKGWHYLESQISRHLLCSWTCCAVYLHLTALGTYCHLGRVGNRYVEYYVCHTNRYFIRHDLTQIYRPQLLLYSLVAASLIAIVSSQSCKPPLTWIYTFYMYLKGSSNRNGCRKDLTKSKQPTANLGMGAEGPD